MRSSLPSLRASADPTVRSDASTIGPVAQRVRDRPATQKKTEKSKPPNSRHFVSSPYLPKAITLPIFTRGYNPLSCPSLIQGYIPSHMNSGYNPHKINKAITLVYNKQVYISLHMSQSYNPPHICTFHVHFPRPKGSQKKNPPRSQS